MKGIPDLVSRFALVLTAAAAAPIVCAEGADPAPPPAAETEAALPTHLKDRGTGVATSMFGTYIRRGELMVYPYWEYYLDNNREYNANELGFEHGQDLRGRYRASEGLFFLAYGITEDLAVQVEGAVIRASLEKSPADRSTMPARLEQSGLGDREIQLRWRLRKEDERRPELWSYVDLGFPHNRDKPLIGTLGREVELGGGITRGFKWGTLTARASVGYDGASDTKFQPGEYAVEYLKRLSPSWRLFGAIQGAEEEITLITEAQWHLTRKVFIRFNQEVGLTPNATDWEPQLGILITLPMR